MAEAAARPWSFTASVPYAPAVPTTPPVPPHAPSRSCQGYTAPAGALASVTDTYGLVPSSPGVTVTTPLRAPAAPPGLAASVPFLEAHYERFESDFREFFPEIRTSVL